MRHVLCALIAGMAALAGAAQEAGPPASAACRDALAALQAREAQAMAARDAGRPTEDLLKSLAPLRRQAARACLGGRGDPPPPSQQPATPAFTVAPAAARPPVPPPSPPAAPMIPAPQRPAAPAMVTNCDPSGCWASDGSRLQRLGPNLVGPRGVCTQQGVLLHCP
jgi:hypothetical protein